MTQIRLEVIVEHLRTQVRRAPHDAVTEVIPEAEVDPHALFRAFKRRLRSRCNAWETVPDQSVNVAT
jgi:hypothetical protein